jgi:hypothetical protein
MVQHQLFSTPQTTLTSDDYYTPQWLFDSLQIQFDLDVASPPHATNVPCKQYLTQAENGLTTDWIGNVWMNPPFRQTAPWAYKFMQHKYGICLVPMSKTKWFNKLWNECEGIVPLPNDFAFQQGNIFLATVLCAYGDANVEALHRIGKVR